MNRQYQGEALIHLAFMYLRRWFWDVTCSFQVLLTFNGCGKPTDSWLGSQEWNIDASFCRKLKPGKGNNFGLCSRGQVVLNAIYLSIRDIIQVLMV